MKPNTIIKSITLLLSWLTLSPLLLILDGRWKLLPKWLRVVLFVLSPLMLILYIVIGVVAYLGYRDYWRKHHFVRRQVIENITGVKMPKFKLVEYEKGNTFFNGDYSDYFTLEFKGLPDSTFYQNLRDNGFDYYEGCYHFYLNWGSGLVEDEVVPKGESGNYGFSMTICEGEKRFTINAGEL